MSVFNKTRNFVFTLNNYTDEELSKLGSCVGEQVRYLRYGKEVGENGTPHLQGMIIFWNRVRFGTVKSVLGSRAHVEAMRGTFNQNIAYTGKDGVLTEFGDRPRTDEEKGALGKGKYEEALYLAKQGRVSEIEAGLQTRYYRTYKQIAVDNMSKPADLSDVCGIWYYGQSGSGKTHTATKNHGDYFDKQLNKWWDGYRNQDTVVIDDLGTDHAFLGHFLKRWADKYPFNAEMKGSACWIRPKLVIVTSQYTIDEVWSDDQTRDALKRRFKCVHVTRDFFSAKQ